MVGPPRRERAFVAGGVDAEREPAGDGEAGAARRTIANSRAVARPPAVGLRLPTMASCGSLRTRTSPRTYSTAGASGDSRSSGG